ncbi:hypothetical protein ACE193_12840 [Bernardetia sp. OM2101]|uniref:hypothetical protein n=1 Tax=Bernardetia sp. OM2101 TaxID=3344876 RepID=UPI0035CED54E
MTNTHHLDKELHSEFLKQGRIDPITGEEIEEGHTIVICSACKSAFFIESWEYLGQTHCNQTETLSEIPKPKNMFLKAKPLEYLPFLFKKGNQDIDNTIHSLVENSIIGIIMLLVVSVLPMVFIFVHPICAFIFALGIVSGTLSYFSNKTSKRLIERKINPKKATQITLNTKAQGITVKKKDKINTFKFDEIQELRYFVEYISDADASNYNQCALSIRIITSENKGKIYYTLLKTDELSKWSEFLEELPYNLKVLQVLREENQL